MFASPDIENAARHGCWQACHSDGVFYDYIQWKSGEDGKGATQVDGYVAKERVNKSGKALVKTEGTVGDGAYTVTFTRKLAGNQADGDLTFQPGQTIPFGVAIHTDKTVWRFHRVSMGYTLGLRAPGDVSALRQ